ncbi:hypothetical protein D8674_003530 [Pyrus ussuriensis x Pyrus communis]|uniref:Uncharacterized protein n=1 Tax=Pyrus ussuriensis x Pyrus communis TaxID=2448454 RepID=A0A5N5FHC6_9ROSA|nr:hypothetical protein D8674_003530 [Pyrus ussuriensis x Pyrus communis]
MPHQAQIQEEVQRLVAEQLRGFQCIDTTDDALRKDVANLSKLPWKFSLPHFTLFKRDEDLDRHLMHYQSAITLYANDNVFMCKIFATTGEEQDCSIKKKSDHLFKMKKDPNKSLHTYIKRFKTEKVKIIGCDNSIACSAFRKELPADHQLLGELIMGENLILANFYALAEKHSLWDEDKCSQKLPKQTDKPLNNKNKPGDKRMDRSPAKGSTAPKTYTKFSVPIN